MGVCLGERERERESESESERERPRAGIDPGSLPLWNRLYPGGGGVCLCVCVCVAPLLLAYACRMLLYKASSGIENTASGLTPHTPLCTHLYAHAHTLLSHPAWSHSFRDEDACCLCPVSAPQQDRLLVVVCLLQFNDLMTVTYPFASRWYVAHTHTRTQTHSKLCTGLHLENYIIAQTHENFNCFSSG